MNRFFILGLSLAFVLNACNSDDDAILPEPSPSGEYTKGVLVVNEGYFGAANASVGFINEEEVYQAEIFKNTNGENLGDVGQSIYTYDDKAFVVLNGSAKVEVVNRYTFERIATISNGLSNPRYVVVENNKAYISNWGDPTNPDDDFLAVVNLNSFTIESTISVVEGPERMTSKDGKVFVAHMGGWNFGKTVSIINTQSNTVSANLETAYVPHGIVVGASNLYVLCSGKEAWSGEETQAGIYVYNHSSNELIRTHSFDLGVHPTHLAIESEKLYYTIGADVYTMDSNATHLPSSPLFSLNDQGVYSAYGFAINQAKIYVSDAIDYVSSGKVHIYSMNNQNIHSIEVGLLPNSFGFNN